MLDWQGEGKVLVVDDDALVRRTIERGLEKCGFEVESAEGGRQGVEKVVQLGHDLVVVLLDLNMPEVSGEKAFRQMQETHPELKVVIVSGYDERDLVGRFTGHPPAGFLRKPFRPVDLQRKMMEVLGVAEPG